MSKFNFSEVRLLQSLHPDTLQRLQAAAIRRKYSAGKIIFSEGEEPKGLYFLAAGKVGIYKNLKDDSAILLHTVAPQQLFGEVSLMNKTTYQDFARADKDAEVIFVKKQDFERTVRQDTNAAFALSMSLSQKLTELRTHIISQQNKTTIAVFANEGPQQEKAWLAVEVAVSLKEQTKKKVLLIDLLSNPHTIEHVLQKKFDYDFILINLPPHKDGLSTSLIMQADFLLNLSGKDLSFYQKLYKPEMRIVAVDLTNDRRLDRLDWRIGNLARVIARRTVGLALGSGSLGGIAAIGVMKYLEEQKVPIDMIAGCSAGSLFGALLSQVGDIKKIREMVKKNFINESIFDFAWSLKGFSGGGLIRGKIKKFFGDSFLLEDMKIPLKVIATNLTKKKIHVFEKGLLWRAIRASIAIPLVFTPLEINSELYIDGNISDPLPINVLKEAKQDKIIAIYASTVKKEIRFNNFMKIFLQSRSIINDNLAYKAIDKTNLFISPDVSMFNHFEHERFNEIYLIGYAAAKKSFRPLF
jgi:NTE family protein